MFAHCLHELCLSEDSAYKRIQAARTAREFPVIFDALAEGRLHLSAVCLLAPYLKPENADALLNAAAHKTKSEIEELLAERFPRSEVLALVQAIVRLGQTLFLQTVAEGIEGAEQLAELQAVGCDIGQGFYLARPMTTTALGELLDTADAPSRG